MKVRYYQELIAWQKAMDLATVVYDVTKSFPRDETYGLQSQIRRAAVSIPSNIAEGAGRRSSGEFLQFLGHALGSLAELETQIILAFRLGYIADHSCDEVLEQAAEVGRISNALSVSIAAKTKKRSER